MSSSDLTEEMPAGAIPLTALRTERPAPDPAKVAELDEAAARFEGHAKHGTCPLDPPERQSVLGQVPDLEHTIPRYRR